MGDRDCVEWSAAFVHTMAEEIRSGVRSGALNWAEADQLLARIRMVVDQALDRSTAA